MPKLAVLFPGQGAYYKGVLAAAYPVYPQIAGTFAEIDEVSKQEFGQTVSDVLFGASPQNSASVLQHSVEYLQFALYGVDVATSKVLEAHGLQPDVLIGHNFGEMAALVCAGAFVKIDSPYPFHSPLLQSSVNDFATRIRHIKQQPLHIPVFSPVWNTRYIIH